MDRVAAISMALSSGWVGRPESAWPTEDSALLDGVPPSTVDRAAVDAAEQDKDGWLLLLNYPTFDALIMSKNDDAGKAARTEMAKASGTDLKGYDAQLATTEMFYKPADAAAFTKDEKLIKTMDFVRSFLFSKGILGEGAKSKDFVGIEFPGGQILGDKNNVKLRFDTTFMAMAADGKL